MEQYMLGLPTPLELDPDFDQLTSIDWHVAAAGSRRRELLRNSVRRCYYDCSNDSETGAHVEDQSEHHIWKSDSKLNTEIISTALDDLHE